MRFATAALTLAAMAFATPAGAPSQSAIAVGYICGAEDAQLTSGPTPTVMLEGVGNGGTGADTDSREAQAWFVQGLNLYHAFNHNEARAAFAKAAELDAACALCEWGVALGLGPTLNYTVTAPQRAEALKHAQAAKALVKPGDTRAAALIDTLIARYASGDTEKAYGQALKALYERWPTDNEIGNLAAHALLTPARAFDYSGVEPAETILKSILARKPDDTAAIHYYIHSSEFLGHPGEALAYAEKLAGLAPGASHLVHMAAHTMMHVGLYQEVALVDAQALKVDADVGARLNYGGPLSSNMYYLHNYNFGLAGSLMAGDGKLAVKYADHAAVAFPESFDKGVIRSPSGSGRNQSAADRRITATARSLVALGRYAPERALTLAARPDEPRVIAIYRHYARGEAYAARRDAPGVLAEAAAIDGLKAEALKASETGNIQISGIAADVLRGRAALLAGDGSGAAGHFGTAAAAQEKAYPFRVNFDPPPWWYPVRRSLAAAELKAGRYAQAAKEAEASLKDWPRDALALRILSQAETKLGKTADARRHAAEARRAWKGGDLARTPLELT